MSTSSLSVVVSAWVTSMSSLLVVGSAWAHPVVSASAAKLLCEAPAAAASAADGDGSNKQMSGFSSTAGHVRLLLL